MTIHYLPKLNFFILGCVIFLDKNVICRSRIHRILVVFNTQTQVGSRQDICQVLSSDMCISIPNV